ncbi:hypothetical protein M9458_052962, partial [Cirrhinus mrigala]
MLQRIKVNFTTEQQGFFWPIPPTRINGHLHQVVCEESTEAHQRLQPTTWIALIVTIRQKLLQNLHQQT